MNNDRQQLDQIILDEVNIKAFVRHVCMTEKGSLDLVYSEGRHFIELAGKEIAAPKLLEKLLNDNRFMS